MMVDMSARWWRSGTLFLHWCEFLSLAAEARDRAIQAEAASSGSTLVGEALSAILFSAMATEAFINELAEVAAYHADVLPGMGVPGAQALADLAATLDRIEEEKRPDQIEEKYRRASEMLSGHAFPAGEAPFQDFARLIKLRNDLVHPRNRDRTTDAGHVEPGSKVIRDLQQGGRTTTRGRRPDDVPGGASWLFEIANVGTASWAYGAAREIVKAAIELLPDRRDFSILAMMRRQFQVAPQ
jgi:hypothetical protein